MTARHERPSIAITAATFTGNHGAEAMLLATMEGLRRRLPAAAFHVFSYYPGQDRDVVTDPSVKIFSLTPLALVAKLVPLAALYALVRALGLRPLLAGFPRDVRALAGSDVQVDLAGVSFVDGREKFLPFNVLSLVPAFVLGVPVVKLAQAMGPFHGPLNRLAARWTLNRCAGVFARGASTLEHVRTLGLHAPVRHAPDVAFLLEPGQDGAEAPGTGSMDALAAIAARREGARSVVGLCPSSLLSAKLGHAYLDLMVALVRALVEAGDLVVLFPNASRSTPEAGPRNNDLYALQQIRRRLPEAALRKVVLVERDLHAPGILRLLAATDMAVVSRFHAMVGSLSVGRPVAVVGWSHKYREVMEAFGMAAHAYDCREVTLPELLASLALFRAGGDGAAPWPGETLAGVRRSAEDQLDFVVETIAKDAGRGRA